MVMDIFGWVGNGSGMVQKEAIAFFSQERDISLPGKTAYDEIVFTDIALIFVCYQYFLTCAALIGLHSVRSILPSCE